MKKIWEGLQNSRKLQAWLLLTVVITAMAFLKEATFQEWLEGQQWLFGIYAAGNIGEHYTTNSKEESR